MTILVRIAELAGPAAARAIAAEFGGTRQYIPVHFAPASGATERQSHTDGQSAPAPSGGHYAMSSTEARMMLDYRGCSAEVQSVISAMADAAANGKGTA